MALGPGKYDAFCTLVRESTKARGVALMIMDGIKGSGFSIQGDIELTLGLAQLLRHMADQIEADMKGKEN